MPTGVHARTLSMDRLRGSFSFPLRCLLGGAQEGACAQWPCAPAMLPSFTSSGGRGAPTPFSTGSVSRDSLTEDSSTEGAVGREGGVWEAGWAAPVSPVFHARPLLTQLMSEGADGGADSAPATSFSTAGGGGATESLLFDFLTPRASPNPTHSSAEGVEGENGSHSAPRACQRHGPVLWRPLPCANLARARS